MKVYSYLLTHSDQFSLYRYRIKFQFNNKNIHQESLTKSIRTILPCKATSDTKNPISSDNSKSTSPMPSNPMKGSPNKISCPRKAAFRKLKARKCTIQTTIMATIPLSDKDLTKSARKRAIDPTIKPLTLHPHKESKP